LALECISKFETRFGEVIDIDDMPCKVKEVKWISDSFEFIREKKIVNRVAIYYQTRWTNDF